MMPAMLAMPGHSEDGELEPGVLARCQAGEAAALRVFVEHYQRAVFALLSRILGQRPEVEDLAQETFLRAIRALRARGFDVDGPARLSTWLLTIATRLALDVCRKRTRERWSPLVAEPTSAVTPEHEAHRAELRGALASAVAELPDDQRVAFVLAEFHGFALEDIAAALQTPKSTVKTRLFRARAKLSQALAHYRGPAE
jgi:RNA polymerase sigma-70 factor (ECF subfamily)